jgi:hypothetical protein
MDVMINERIIQDNRERRTEMEGIKRTASLLVLLAMVMTLGACGEKEQTVTGAKAKNEPEWIVRGSGAFKDEEGLAFYGVGAVQGISNRGLELQTVDQRARADLARALDTYVANFMKDYMASAVASDMEASEEEQFVSSITKSITEATLVGSQIAARWRAPDGTLWALAKLSFDDVANTMKSEMRKRAAELKMNANEAMEELDEQLEKRRASGM